MNALVDEYRSLPPKSDHLGDTSVNFRKCEILFALDEQANDSEVSQLLLEVLRDPLEFDLARVEAIKVAGLFIIDDNPLAAQIWAELSGIAAGDKDEMLRGWAERSVDLWRQRRAK